MWVTFFPFVLSFLFAAAPVVWFVSHCHARSGRDEFVRELGRKGQEDDATDIQYNISKYGIQTYI